MTATAEEEATTAEVVQYRPPAGVEEYRPRILMAPDEAKAQDEALRAAMSAVLREGTDFGTIPGAAKPSLFKPGAEKLLQWFGFGHRMECVDTERATDGTRIGVTYRCTVIKAMPDGREITVAECEGYAGYDEDRFYQSAEQAEAKERANAERYRRQVNTTKFVEYRAPWNSVIKMCEKRALVGAALQATSASTLFTQDIEDGSNDGTGGSAPAAFAEVARGIVAQLPAAVADQMDTWYRRKKWPNPDSWDAERWGAALVEAGRLSYRHELAQAPAGDAAEDTATDVDQSDPWQVAIEEITTKAEADKLDAELREEFKAGRVTTDQANELRSAIKARKARVPQ